MYSPKPVSWLLDQPIPWPSGRQPSGSGPTKLSATRAVHLAERVAADVSATVSSSFMAIRLNVSRMSWADRIASGTPFGPWGLT